MGLLLLATLAGCDSGQSVSADANSGSDSAADAQPAGVPNLYMILPANQSPENGMWEQAATIEAGRRHAPLRVVRPGLADPPGRQADLIRQAVDTGASALLIEADDPKAVASALEEARAAGVPILLLDRDVPVSGKPLRRITYTPIDRLMKELVGAAVDAAKSFGAPADGPAVILLRNDIKREPRDVARLQSMRKALKEAGVTTLPDVEFRAGQDIDALIKKAWESKPQPMIVMAEDDTLYSAANRIAVAGAGGNPLPVLAGCLSQPTSHNMLKIGGCVAAIDMNYTGFGRQAIDTALAMARGETLPDLVTVEMSLKLGPKLSRRPTMEEFKGRR